MLEYIILGIIQGFFEWLPISSEGAVAIASQFLIKGFHPLEIALFAHLGTFFAVLIYFRKEWLDVLTFKNKKSLFSPGYSDSICFCRNITYCMHKKRSRFHPGEDKYSDLLNINPS